MYTQQLYIIGRLIRFFSDNYIKHSIWEKNEQIKKKESFRGGKLER